MHYVGKWSKISGNVINDGNLIKHASMTIIRSLIQKQFGGRFVKYIFKHFYLHKHIWMLIKIINEESSGNELATNHYKSLGNGLV